MESKPALFRFREARAPRRASIHRPPPSRGSFSVATQKNQAPTGEGGVGQEDYNRMNIEAKIEIYQKDVKLFSRWLAQASEFGPEAQVARERAFLEETDSLRQELAQLKKKRGVLHSRLIALKQENKVVFNFATFDSIEFLKQKIVRAEQKDVDLRDKIARTAKLIDVYLSKWEANKKRFKLTSIPPKCPSKDGGFLAKFEAVKLRFATAVRGWASASHELEQQRGSLEGALHTVEKNIVATKAAIERAKLIRAEAKPSSRPEEAKSSAPRSVFRPVFRSGEVFFVKGVHSFKEFPFYTPANMLLARMKLFETGRGLEGVSFYFRKKGRKIKKVFGVVSSESLLINSNEGTIVLGYKEVPGSQTRLFVSPKAPVQRGLGQQTQHFQIELASLSKIIVCFTEDNVLYKIVFFF